MKSKRLWWRLSLSLAIAASLLAAMIPSLPHIGAQGAQTAVSTQWAQRAPMPTPRHTGATVVVDGIIYTIGGVGGLTYYPYSPFPGGPTYNIPGVTLETYNPAANTWAAKNPIPRTDGRWGLAAAASGGKIYTFGGASLTGGPTTTVDEYDIATETWTLNVAALPAAATGMAAVAYSDKIYLFGGSASTEVFAPEHYYRQTYLFDPAARTFTTKAPMMNPRTTAFAAVRGTEIYVLAGISAWGNRNNQVYSPATDSWRAEPSLAWERGGWVGAAANDMFFIMGVTTEHGGAAIPTADVFIPSQGTWTTANAALLPRTYAFAAGSGGKLYLMGGMDSQNNPLTTVEEGTLPATPPIIQPPTTPTATTAITWLARAAMPTPRSFGATVVVGNIIYTIGGLDGDPGTGTVMESYDPVTNTWTRQANLPQGRWGLAAAAYGGKVYTFGGADMNLRVTDTVNVYDIVSNTWTPNIAALPQAATGITAITYGDKIYLFGGSRNPQLFAPSSNYMNNVYEFDPQSRAFTPKAAMPTARNLSFSGIMGNNVYVIGGVESPGATANRQYNPSSNSWSEGTNMPERRGGHSGAIAGDNVYILGGHNENVVYTYDPAQESWTRATAMTSARNLPFAAGADDRIYVMGGSDASGNTIGSGEEGTPAGAAVATPTPLASPTPPPTPTVPPTPTSLPTITPVPTPTTPPGANIVAEQLTSIASELAIVYSYDPANAADPWQIYDPQAPAFANDLRQLESGRGYWIKVNSATTITSRGITRSLSPGWNLVAWVG